MLGKVKREHFCCYYSWRIVGIKVTAIRILTRTKRYQKSGIPYMLKLLNSDEDQRRETIRGS